MPRRMPPRPKKGCKPANAGRRFPPEPLTRDEIHALLRCCSRRAPTGRRNAALIALLYRTGLRISEALSLEPKDLDPDAGTVRVLHGKGGRNRIVGCDPQVFVMIDAWLQVRPRRAMRVFTTLQGGPLDASYFRKALTRLAARAGIAKRCHPHGFRHSMAVELVRENVPMPIVQRQLGHASLSTTAAYLQSINPQEVVDAVRGRGDW